MRSGGCDSGAGERKRQETNSEMDGPHGLVLLEVSSADRTGPLKSELITECAQQSRAKLEAAEFVAGYRLLIPNEAPKSDRFVPPVLPESCLQEVRWPSSGATLRKKR